MTSVLTDRIYGESSGVAVKAPCLSVSVGAPLPLVGLGAVGGYVPNPGDRILVKDQADPKTNGIYNASAGAWARSGDFNGPYDAVQGTLIVVYYPNSGATIYQLTTFMPVIGTTPLVFASFVNPNAPYAPGNVLLYGADPTGVFDSTAAFRNAIMVAGATLPVIVPAGTYLLSSALLLPLGLNIVGVNNQFTYGLFPQQVILKATSAAVMLDTQGLPYITIKNITLNGNGIASAGVNGGYFTNMDSVSIINCNGPGLALVPALSLVSKYLNCAFNGNQDGVYSAPGTVLTTQYFDKCVFRQNARYGINGGFAASNFHDNIFESNIGSGANLTGACNSLSFTGTNYFEANDFANGANGYQVRIAVKVTDDPIIFNTTSFSSLGFTQVANVTSGRVKFSFCQQGGSQANPQLTVAPGAEVILEKSFLEAPVPPNVKIVQEVQTRADHAVLMSTLNDYIVTNVPAIILGVADFTASAVLEMNTTTATQRCVCSGTTGFQVVLSGSVGGGMTGIVFSVQGSASFHTTATVFPYNLPMHLVYVRQAGVASVYLNGVLIDTFADANNYTGTQASIGSDLASLGLGGKLYAFTYVGSALSAQQVFDLWRCGGDAEAAKIPGTTFDLRFDVRPQGWIYNVAATKWLAFQGAAAWVSPQPNAVTANTVGAAGGAAALPATPLGYKFDFVGGVQVKTPYYNV